MIAELGHLALIFAFMAAIAQSIFPLVGAQRNSAELMALAGPLALAQFLFCGLAFAALTYAFVTSDFSLAVVYGNSHSAKPLIYKVTGVWGNHEGSMLLWVLILTLFGAACAAFGASLPPGLKARALSVQAMIGVAFFAFILFTSNPFARLTPTALDGNDLNPLLQDLGLAIHPPFLYLGYVGFSMSFSFAVAALIEGRVDAAWARWVRPWTLAAWSFLTVGIALGSFWAYYELGWGGWWFWDPVENASFMPWLVGTALLHSAIVVEKRAALKSWTILLAILAFALSLIGTFIVRSGVITSVHAFANDPERGVFILAILLVAIGGALALYAWRAPMMSTTSVFSPISREGGLILNNVFLSAAAGVVFIGTLWPLVREVVWGDKISVGAPFFNATFAPMMIPLLLALPVGAMLPWKRGDLAKALSKLWFAAALAVFVAASVAMWRSDGPLMAPLGVGLAAWLVFGALADLLERIRLFAAPAGAARRAMNLPRSVWGQIVAHMGVGVTVFGIVAVSAWQLEVVKLAKPGEGVEIGGYSVRFDEVHRARGPNYRADVGQFTVLQDGVEISHLTPEKRFYPVQGVPTTEAAINRTLARDVYVVLGDKQKEGEAWTVRVYVKPFTNWIWLGALIMTFGGMLSLSDRRHRVGAPVLPKARAAQAESV